MSDVYLQRYLEEQLPQHLEHPHEEGDFHPEALLPSSPHFLNDTENAERCAQVNTLRGTATAG
jgi:hypothetical protein